MTTIVQVHTGVYVQVCNLVTNLDNMKRDGLQVAQQCHMDRQMLTELHDKYQLLRMDKGLPHHFSFTSSAALIMP